MNQTEVRTFIEQYFQAFQSHIVENHPDYLTVKLPVEVDKDIGNRPFYWTWVEKMNIAPQPLSLTLYFKPGEIPKDLRAESVHFGAKRLQQIFGSTMKYGKYVCMYEHAKGIIQRSTLSTRRSTGLTPWLVLNYKISFICDKKRDLFLSLGINLHQPRVVREFYPFLQLLHLSPSIPDYFYTNERRVTLSDAAQLAHAEVNRFINEHDHDWAEEAKVRLQEELEILEEYYKHQEQTEKTEDPPDNEEQLPQSDNDQTIHDQPLQPKSNERIKDGLPTLHQKNQLIENPVSLSMSAPPTYLNEEQAETVQEHMNRGGRILDFLRMNGIAETSKEEINQAEWKASSLEEEYQRRREELCWQYEPRVEVKVINAGLFYLFNLPPV
ncbi:YqhG family protein [Brevibacillus daliensis]|uniref:YqhG family protein n=1 Tax=Brevibacillus daliensis TaxID=2892995 RepID=UPI001E535E27|nr:YqhG family protein [Brevibacillus daliensis]